MPDEFQYDAFLSHSAKDTPVVRELAVRLKKDGIRVWLGEEQIKPHDSAPEKIEEGLEHSRALVLCMSANVTGPDWAQLEAGTFRFRDASDNRRRFVPVRLDNSPIEGPLAQFLFVDLSPENRDLGYEQLVKNCHAINVASSSRVVRFKEVTGPLYVPTSSPLTAFAFSSDGTRVVTAGKMAKPSLWDVHTGTLLGTLKKMGPRSILSVAWSQDEALVFAGSSDGRIRVWNPKATRCSRVFSGHRGPVNTVASCSDPTRILSGGADGSIRLWDTATGKCMRTFQGQGGAIHCVSWGANRLSALAGTHDGMLMHFSFHSDQELSERLLLGHTETVHCVDWSSDQRFAVSGAADKTLRLWDLKSGKCLKVFEGHTQQIRSVSWCAENSLVLSASWDRTIRVWDVESGACVGISQEDSASIYSVVWQRGGKSALSGNATGGVRKWDLSRILSRRTARPRSSKSKGSDTATHQVQYTNAKVLLVGESGVGKTGLSNYLAHHKKVEEEKPISSTDGAWATHWPLNYEKQGRGVEREIWLWDFAGQVDYRLVHQLFMDDTAAAVLVFNPQSENPYEGLGYWDRDLQKAARKPFAKLLAAARIDRGGLVVSAVSMKKFMKERGFLGSLHLTSAKTGEGCDELRKAIVQAIDWKSIPETTSPLLYHRLKQEILRLRDGGMVLLRLGELKQRIEMTLRDENFELADLETVVGLLSGPGMIQRLDFGGFILLRPEVLSRYGAAVVRKVRKHPQELGCIREDELLAGHLDYQDFKRLESKEDEAVVLRTLLETFISRAWCLRQPCDGSAMLTFPSYFRRERNEQPSHPSVLVTYRFDGPADDIYATLVVRLHHTVAFQSTELWKSAADFKTQVGAKLGFTLLRDTEGSSRLEVYFEPDVDSNSRVLFLRYVHNHLDTQGRNVVRLRHYCCNNKKCKDFGKAFKDREAIEEVLASDDEGKVFCGKCGKPIFLHDVIEEKFKSARVIAEALFMKHQAIAAIDNESRELILVGHAFSIVAEAGQIYRGYTNSDHGIDGEIEFKDDQGRASGKRLYLQLKSGDSHLKKRKDGAEVFQIRNPRWADYWQQQAYAVMLVIRTSDGEIRWMDVSTYLKEQRARDSGMRAKSRQIVFSGERFDAVRVQIWRRRILGLP